MPSNHILINNAIEYSIPDSKMENFLLWLDENGYPTNTGIKKETDEIIPEPEAISCSQSQS